MPTTIYGGPYAHENEAIIAEAQKKKPNFDKLIANWNTITQGALEVIEGYKNPVDPASGEFSKNFKLSKEEAENPYIPTVTLYTVPDEKAINQDAADHVDDPDKNVTAPIEKKEETPSVNLDDL